MLNTQFLLAARNICHASYKSLKHAETQTEKNNKRQQKDHK